MVCEGCLRHVTDSEITCLHLVRTIIVETEERIWHIFGFISSSFRILKFIAGSINLPGEVDTLLLFSGRTELGKIMIDNRRSVVIEVISIRTRSCSIHLTVVVVEDELIRVTDHCPLLISIWSLGNLVAPCFVLIFLGRSVFRTIDPFHLGMSLLIIPVIEDVHPTVFTLRRVEVLVVVVGDIDDALVLDEVVAVFVFLVEGFERIARHGLVSPVVVGTTPTLHVGVDTLVASCILTGILIPSRRCHRLVHLIIYDDVSIEALVVGIDIVNGEQLHLVANAIAVATGNNTTVACYVLEGVCCVNLEVQCSSRRIDRRVGLRIVYRQATRTTGSCQRFNGGNFRTARPTLAEEVFVGRTFTNPGPPGCLILFANSRNNCS